jgi:hypothetical protein
MKRLCRTIIRAASLRRQLAMAELLGHARIMADPAKLAYLQRKAKAENDRSRARRHPAL